MPGQLLISDFGATGDGLADDGPAFRAAFNALLSAGGGRLLVPKGSFRIATPSQIDGGGTHNVRIEIVGLGSASRILIDTPSNTMWSWASLGSVEFDHLTFIGFSQARFVDASVGIDFSSVGAGKIRRCSFFGIGVAWSLVRWTQSSGVSFHENEVLGCGNAQQVGLLYTDHWTQFDVSDSQFIDYGNLDSVYYAKTPMGCFSWIHCGDPNSQVSGSIASHAISVQRCGFDEGATAALRIYSNSGTGRFDRVSVRDSNFLIGVGTAIYIEYAKNVALERLSFSSNDWPRTAIALNRLSGRARISQCTHDPGTRGTGTIAYTIDTEARNTPSRSVFIEDSEYTTIVQGDGSTMGDAALVTGVSDGIRWRLHRASGPIAANSLVQASGEGANVLQLSAGDSPSQAIGVALDDAPSANTLVRVASQRGQTVAIKSDGLTGIQPGDRLTASTSSSGRAAPAASGSALGRALSAAAATADSLVQILWSGQDQ